MSIKEKQIELFYRGQKARINRGLSMLTRSQSEIKPTMLTKSARNSLKVSQKETLLQKLDQRLASAHSKQDQNLIEQLLTEQQYILKNYA